MVEWGVLLLVLWFVLVIYYFILDLLVLDIKGGVKRIFFWNKDYFIVYKNII